LHELLQSDLLFSFGGRPESLSSQHVANLNAAIVNARAFAGEVISILRGDSDETKESVKVA